MSPQNRDLHRLILKVKEEKATAGRMNNNSPSEREIETGLGGQLPVGAGLGAKFKFVDDTSDLANSNSRK